MSIRTSVHGDATSTRTSVRRSVASTAALCLCLLLSGVAPRLQGSGVLSIAVTPRYAFEPATLSVRVRHERSTENRALEIVADCTTYFRSSEIFLEGERAPATIEWIARGVPGGDCHVFAVLKGSGGRARATATQNVTIMAAPGGRDGGVAVVNRSR